MIKISQQQAINRWDTLPDNIRVAIFSDYNAEILWRACENQHLTEDKIQTIAALAGNVLMGFIHPEDFSTEIREALNINPEIANVIAVEVDKKIFNPLKSDLKNIYQPLGIEAEEGPAGESSGVLDLREKPSFEIVENKIDLSKFAAPHAAPVEFGLEAKVEKSDQSRTPTAVGEQKEPEIKTETAAPKETLAEKSDQGRTPTAVGGEKAEQKGQDFVSFETASQPQTQPLEEAPLMIHKEEEIKPLAGKWKSLGGMFGFLKKRQSELKEEPAVRASFEIGGEERPKEEEKVDMEINLGQNTEVKPEQKPEINIEEKPQIKVVDYSEPAPAFAAEKPMEKAPEKITENLPIAKEDLTEIKPEIKAEAEETEAADEQITQKPISEIMPEPKVEEIKIEAAAPKIEELKPQIEPKNNPEETIDLSAFK